MTGELVVLSCLQDVVRRAVRDAGMEQLEVVTSQEAIEVTLRKFFS